MKIAFTNPVIGSDLGGKPGEASSGATFTSYFVTIWNAFITIGAIMVLINFLWGALEWITAGGDSGKIEKGRNRITQSMIGLLILVSSFVIIGFISEIFFGSNFNILNLNFNAPGGATEVEESSEEDSQTSIIDNNSLKFNLNLFSPPVIYAADDTKSVNLNIGSTAAGRGLPGTADYNPNDGESGFGKLMGDILEIVIVIGAVMVLINFLWGGLEWITAGGDSGKVEKGRNRITQSIVGLIVLASVIALFVMMQGFLKFEVFNFNGSGGGNNTGYTYSDSENDNCVVTGNLENAGNEGYCIDNFYTLVICVEPEPLDKYNFNHYIPCECEGGKKNQEPLFDKLFKTSQDRCYQ